MSNSSVPRKMSCQAGVAQDGQIADCLSCSVAQNHPRNRAATTWADQSIKWIPGGATLCGESQDSRSPLLSYPGVLCCIQFFHSSLLPRSPSMPYMETKSTFQSRTTETIKLTEPAERIQAEGILRCHRRGYLTRDRIIFGAKFVRRVLSRSTWIETTDTPTRLKYQ